MSDLIFFVDGVFYNLTGLLFVALGILVLIRHTGFPDLTVDGSFTMGAALFAVSFSAGFGFFFALFLAMAAGIVSGLLTAFSNLVLGISKVVAGVLSMSVLILSAPYVSGGGTVGLLQLHGSQEFLNQLDVQISAAIGVDHLYVHFATALFWFAVGCALAGFLYRFLQSRLGTCVRYIGSAENPAFVGMHQTRLLTVLGLAIGNSLIAAGGAIEALRRGAYTVNMGIGTLLLGLTIVILGEAVMKTVKQRDYLTLREQFLGVGAGLLLYGILLQSILSLGLSYIDLKLATTLLLLVLLGIAGRFFPNTKRLF